MNVIKEFNPFSLGLSLLGYNRTTASDEQKKASEHILDEVGTFEFGPMTLSKKFVFLEKKATYCIVPPTPIMPGRTIL